jgi:hypothetical protein
LQCMLEICLILSKNHIARCRPGFLGGKYGSLQKRKATELGKWRGATTRHHNDRRCSHQAAHYIGQLGAVQGEATVAFLIRRRVYNNSFM